MQKYCPPPSPLSPGRARLFDQRVQEEGDGFVHLVHADPPQHLLQEGQGERVVVSPPAVASHHRDATWWRKGGGAACVGGGSLKMCISVSKAVCLSYCGSSRGCRGGATGLCLGSGCPRGASPSLLSSPTGKHV